MQGREDSAARRMQRDFQLIELQQRSRYVSYYQALLMLERLFDSAVSIGHEGPPEGEVVRVRPSISLAHPASDVESIEIRPEDERVQVTATFLGLYGADSPLPTAYAEHIADIRGEPGGERVRGFLDIFHHRLYSLLYRAWTKSRPVSGTPDKPDPLYDRALSLIGYSRALGLGGKRLPRLREARLLALRTRTASGLTSLLKYRLGYDVVVRQLESRRTALPADQRTRVGKQSSELGQSLMLGSSVRDRGKVTIDVVARDFVMWINLLPEGPERRKIDDAIEGYLRDPIDYDVRVTLASEHVPPVQLGNPGQRLGRTAWLGKPTPYAVKRWRRRRDRRVAGAAKDR